MADDHAAAFAVTFREDPPKSLFAALRAWWTRKPTYYALVMRIPSRDGYSVQGPDKYDLVAVDQAGVPIIDLEEFLHND